MNKEYIGEDRRSVPPPPELGWHLKKEVNVSIIISVIGITVACITAYTDLKKDIELIKADTTVLHQRDTQQMNDLDRAISAIQNQYIRMEAKLDRLIERKTP
jgi:hypothetical protein